MAEEKVATLEELVEELRGATDEYVFREATKRLFGEVVAELRKFDENWAILITKVSDETKASIEGLIERVEEVKGLLRPERELPLERAKVVARHFGDVIKAVAEASGALGRDGFGLSYSFDAKRGYLLARVSCMENTEG